MCRAKNRRCESSRVTSPVSSFQLCVFKNKRGRSYRKLTPQAT